MNSQMYEMTDLAQQEELDFESRSRTVSFPDHYLIPYIERCKKSRRITCGCSLIFIGLAIFCFVAINHMTTQSRKIAMAFAAVSCLVAAASCLQLRFKIFNQCRDIPDDDTLFEIAHREDVVPSNSFDMWDWLSHSEEGDSKSDTPNETFSLVHSADDLYNGHFSPFRYNPHGRLPRHSISGGHSQEIPLLPPKKSSLSRVDKDFGSERIQVGATANNCSNYHPNYSTFEDSNVASEYEILATELKFKNVSDESEKQILTSESTFENDCDKSETGPLLAGSTYGNPFDAHKTELLTSESVFVNDYGESETKPLLAGSTYRNPFDAHETELLTSESALVNDYDESETKLLLDRNVYVAHETELLTSESALVNDYGESETKPLLAGSAYRNPFDAHETELLTSESAFVNDYGESETKLLLDRNVYVAHETEFLTSEFTLMNGCGLPKSESLLDKSTVDNGCDVSETKSA